MSGRRAWYLAGLVTAVLALLVSVGVVAALVTHRSARSGTSTAAEGWWQDSASSGMPGFGRGGMMGDRDGASVTAEQATTTAQAWVEAHEPGGTLSQPVLMPMGYLFTVTRDGRAIGTVMVNDDTGRVVWMGGVPLSPTPSASPTGT